MRKIKLMGPNLETTMVIERTMFLGGVLRGRLPPRRPVQRGAPSQRLPPRLFPGQSLIYRRASCRSNHSVFVNVGGRGEYSSTLPWSVAHL